MRRSSLHRGLVAGLLATALLTGCGDEGPDGSSDGSSTETAADSTPTPRSGLLAGDPLDLAEASSALWVEANLPGYASLGAQEPGNQGDQEPTEPGTACDADTPFVDQFDRGGLAVSTSDISYLYTDDQRLLIVSEYVVSFAQDDEAEFALSALADDLDGCTHFEETEDGQTSTLDIEIDDDTSDGADQQLNMVGTGLFTAPEQGDVEVGVGFSAARVGNNVTLTELIGLGYAADSELHLPYTDLAVSRLASVMDGEAPTEEPGPTPDEIPRSRLPGPATQATLEQFLAVAPGIFGGS